MASGGLLDGPWGAPGPQDGGQQVLLLHVKPCWASPGGGLGGPGPPKTSPWRPWNAPRAKSRPILLSWRVPGSLGGALGCHCGGFFAVGLAGTKKKPQKCRQTPILKAFFACVFLPLPCVFCSPRRSPAQKHNLTNCLKPLVFVVESAYAPFARAARQSFKPNESRTK